MIPPLLSYMSPQQASTALGHEPWASTDGDETPARGECPSLNSLSATRNPWSHEGEEGELELIFVNDRLMRTLFYPGNPEAYLRALRRSGLDLHSYDEDRDLKIQPRTTVWAFRLADGDRPYVSWMDQALSDEEGRWIARCS